MSLIGDSFGSKHVAFSGSLTRAQNDGISVLVSDKTQKLKKEDGVFVLTGEVSNRGFAPSKVVIDLDDDTTLLVSLERGMTPAQTAAKIEAALPDGYELDVVESDRGSVLFTIERTAGDAVPTSKRTPPKTGAAQVSLHTADVFLA